MFKGQYLTNTILALNYIGINEDNNELSLEVFAKDDPRFMEIMTVNAPMVETDDGSDEDSSDDEWAQMTMYDLPHVHTLMEDEDIVNFKEAMTMGASELSMVCWFQVRVESTNHGKAISPIRRLFTPHTRL